METDVTGNNWQSTRYTLIGSVLEFNFIVSARQDTKPRSPVDTDFHVLDEVGLQRRRVKCINHYWYVRDDFYLGYKQRDLSFSIRHGRNLGKGFPVRARMDSSLYRPELSSIVVRTEENWRLSRPFFVFSSREKFKMTREIKRKGIDRTPLPFLFFFFFFPFYKKEKRLSLESKTIRFVTRRFNIPRLSSQSSIVREIKITGSA